MTEEGPTALGLSAFGCLCPPPSHSPLGPDPLPSPQTPASACLFSQSAGPHGGSHPSELLRVSPSPPGAVNLPSWGHRPGASSPRCPPPEGE